MIRAWLEAKLGASEATEALIFQTESEIQVAVDEGEKESWTGFKRDETRGLYLEGRQVKAMLKECANVLREQLGITAFKARVAERVFVEEDQIYLGKEEPDGSVERPIHVMTRMGPMTALKKADYVEDATVCFTLRALKQPMLTKEKDRIMPSAYIPLLLKLGQNIGLGADRSQGNGRFIVTKFEVIPNETEPE